MSFSKAATSLQYATYQEQLAGSFVKQNLAQEFVENLEYSRDHPLYYDWKEWKSVVSRFYSYEVGVFQKVLFNQSSDILSFEYDRTPLGAVIFDAGVFAQSANFWSQYKYEQLHSILSEVLYSGRKFYPGDFDFRPGSKNAWCPCVKQYWGEDSNNYPYEECQFQYLHILNIYISLIFQLQRKCRRSLRKYYRNLARVFYVLPVRFLLNIDINVSGGIQELLFPPQQVPRTSRNLLRWIYERGIFDKLSVKEFNQIPYLFENWKHFKDDSTNQSVSATIFDSLADFVSKSPEQQFNFPSFCFNHKVSVDSEEYTKFGNLVSEAQDKFMENLQVTLFDSAKEISVLFVFVATIAMLGYTVVKYGLKVILRALNLLYQVVKGSLFITETSEGIVEQSGGLSIPFIPALILDKVIGPPSSIMTKIWNNPQTDRIMRRIGYLGDPKMSRGIDKIGTWLTQVIESTIKWYKETILGLAVQENIETSESPVIKWYSECDSFFESYYAGEMQWTDINWSVLMNLYGRGMALTRQAIFAEFKQDIWKIVFKIGNLLEKFNAHGRTGNSVRNPPVTIYMAGGTGVGKSSVTYPLAAEILKGIYAREPGNLDLAKYWKNLIYMRSPEQEFWDGYENQLVTVFDDFGQLVDTSSSPNLELFEIIRAANSFPYPLHMASLDQKATTTFNSKIIMVSSNLDRPKTASLNFETALFRRFDICVKVSRKPGVTVVPGEFNPDIYLFQKYDMVTQELGDFISYKDLVYDATCRYFERKGFVDSMDSYISKTLSPVQQMNEEKKKNVKGGKQDSQRIREAKERLSDAKLCWEIDSNKHPILWSYKSPKQQGFGTAAGNTVCSIKFGVKSVMNYCHQNYCDFVDTITGKAYERYINDVKNALNNFKSRLQRCKNGWEQFKLEHSYLYKALKFVGIVVLVLGVIKLYNSFTMPERKNKLMSAEQFVKGGFTKSVPSNAYAESYCPPQIKNPKVEVRAEGYNPPQIKNPRVESEVHPIQEGVKDVNASEILMKIIRSNFYKIYSYDSKDAIGHALFLRGRIVMCPRHYVSAFKRIQASGGSNKIYLQNVFLDRAFECDVDDILKNAYYHESPEENGIPVLSRDIMAFPLRTATFHGNIIPYFADKTSLTFVRNSDIVMPVLCNNNISKSSRAIVAFRYAKGRSGLAVKEETLIDDENGCPQRLMRNIWEYSMDTQASECGAPLIVRNVNIAPGKIVGMHVAGHDVNGLGYATPVYKSDVEIIVGKFPKWDSVEFQLKQQLNEYPLQQCQVPEEAEFIRLGSVDKQVAQPSKSKIIPSPLFNKITDVKTKPCALKQVNVNGESFDPRKYRLARLGNVPQFIRQLEIDFAVQALVDDISENIHDYDFGPNIKSVYTFKEAVEGIDGEEFINSIKRNTSPGYPFVHLKGFENRKNIFGDEEKCDLARPQVKILEQRVRDIISNCEAFKIKEHIFMDTLKDERKLLHKAHKTRLFSAGPLDYLIACKQYFNGIVAVLQKSRNVNGISVGTNVYSTDWSTIARVIQSKSNNIVAGDFEGFDASQIVQLLEAAGKVLIELSKRFCNTSETEADVMWCLLVSLFNSVHITGNEVYMWTHSLPSGHYLTAIINSIFVLLSFCVVYQLHKGKSSYTLARNFYKRFGKVAYGDDHVISVPSDEKDFNQMTLTALFAKIGLSYTMECKDEVAEIPFRKLNDVSYLKRRFVYNKDYQRWLAPLDLGTVLESPMWLHKCADPVSQVCAQIDNSLRELSLHSEEEWNIWYPVFAKEGKHLGHYTEFANLLETRADVLD